MARLWFTLSLCVLGLLSAARAHADRVVLLPPAGSAGEDERDRIEEAIAAAIVAAGHEAVTERGVAGAAPSDPPETANEMAAIAQMQSARYLVFVRVTPLQARYELFLRVGYAPDIRVEELRLIVPVATEAERLQDVMRSILRPSGLGEDALRLTEDPGDGQSAADAEARARAAAELEERRRREEEAARLEHEERERQRAGEARRREEAAWEGRERYGTRDGRRWLLQASLDFRPILSHDADREGGVLTGFAIRGGRSFDGVPGLELRASFDVMTGATNGFAVTGGAVYLTSPFRDVPVFVGGTVELGVFQALTGNRVPSFLVRGSPVVVWRVADNVYLEGVLPEFQLLSANGGVASLGFSARAGLRF